MEWVMMIILLVIIVAIITTIIIVAVRSAKNRDYNQKLHYKFRWLMKRYLELEREHTADDSEKAAQLQKLSQQLQLVKAELRQQALSTGTTTTTTTSGAPALSESTEKVVIELQKAADDGKEDPAYVQTLTDSIFKLTEDVEKHATSTDAHAIAKQLEKHALELQTAHTADDDARKAQIAALATNLDKIKAGLESKLQSHSANKDIHHTHDSNFFKSTQIDAGPGTRKAWPQGWGGGVRTWDLQVDATTKTNRLQVDNDINMLNGRSIRSDGRLHVATGEKMYLLPKGGVHVTKDWDASGDLKVDGTTQVNKLKLGDKWTLSGVGDAHGNDGWLRVFNKDGTGYHGGVAAGNLWSGSDVHVSRNAHVGGALNVKGDTTIGKVNIQGGTSKFNPKGWQTHFPWRGDRKNYIRGDTNVDGHLDARGTMNVNNDVTMRKNATINGALKANQNIELRHKSSTISSGGRLHVNPQEILWLLPKKGVNLTADQGAEPTLRLASGGKKRAQICLTARVSTATTSRPSPRPR